ncbi:hypothetical protein D3C86_1940000 [compost metagenome]
MLLTTSKAAGSNSPSARHWARASTSAAKRASRASSVASASAARRSAALMEAKPAPYAVWSHSTKMKPISG